ncbi:urea transporter [Streptomyces sp. NPDC014006]|uniref:urea transporter n=1 Tax=Streptomyces sp. NPDC014006 TaxID=3364870 RepID=UPI0037002B83
MERYGGVRWGRAGYGSDVGARALRGVAQVMFVRNAWAGAAFCLALVVADWRYAVYALAGAASGAAGAQLFGVARERVEAGLEGFNACLFALCCAVFLDAGRPSTVLLAVAGSLVVTVATAALVRMLRVWHLPPLTAPYCLLASAVTVAAPAFGRIRPHGDGLAALPRAAAGLQLRPAELWRGFLRNVGQVFFLDEWYAGGLLLAGLFLVSRVAGLVACAGSATGVLTAWILGIRAGRIADGTAGCSAVLVALALCGVFLAATRRTLLYALLGAATATAVTPAVAALLAPSGGHPFTWPFVLTTLAFLAAARSFSQLSVPTRPAGPLAAPEAGSRPG